MLNIMLAETGAAELTKLTLVQDLAAVMLVAGIVAALFHLLGWPKVIGYIVAGSLMRMKFFNNLLISNEESINVLANLGIIFLMFTLGLELNIRKLRKLGRTVFPAAIYDLGMMILIGYVVGRQILGWDTIPSLFLGGVICDSSTTLLAKSLDEMGCSKEKFASVIFGTTISEDVLTIGIMAILTGLGMTGRFQAGELAKQLGLLGLFLTGVFIFGLLLADHHHGRDVRYLADRGANELQPGPRGVSCRCHHFGVESPQTCEQEHRRRPLHVQRDVFRDDRPDGESRPDVGA